MVRRAVRARALTASVVVAAVASASAATYTTTIATANDGVTPGTIQFSSIGVNYPQGALSPCGTATKCTQRA